MHSLLHFQRIATLLSIPFNLCVVKTPVTHTTIHRFATESSHRNIRVEEAIRDSESIDHTRISTKGADEESFFRYTSGRWMYAPLFVSS